MTVPEELLIEAKRVVVFSSFDTPEFRFAKFIVQHFEKSGHSDSESLTQRLKNLLEEYKLQVDAAVTEGKSRHLEMHITSRQIFEQQSSLINELLDSLDEGEEIIA